jgi:thiol-disulfide isomerase/thioredoxin
MTISKWHIFPAILAALLATRAQEPAPDRSGATGILLHKQDASLLIRHLVMDSPARDSGQLDVGDELLAIEEAGQPRQEMEGKSVDEALSLLAGPPGSEVTVHVHSAGSAARSAKLTRAKLTRGVQDAELQLLEEGSAIPDFGLIDLIDGQTNRFAALRGQPVMVVFWAAWDPRSRAAMATLQRKLPEFPEDIQPRVIAINLDHDQAEALDYVASRDWGGMRHLWTDGEAAEAFRIRNLPAGFLIDANGLLRKSGDPVSLDAKTFLTSPTPPK